MNWPSNSKSPKRFSKSLLLTLTLLTTGCSQFSRQWRAAASASPPSDIQGRWEGTWSSQTNGHHGRLRCLMTKKAAGEYQAFFHANYKTILSFSYNVPLTMEQQDGTFHFTGGADLGKMAGGFYHYDGHATATNFFSTYQAPADGGVFEMKRP